MSMDYSDYFLTGEISSCCGSPVYNPAGDDVAICRDCKEWCEVVREEEEWKKLLYY